MLGRLFRGLIVGALAAFGASSVGLDEQTTLVIFIIPVLVAMVDMLTGQVFTLFVVFGLGCLLWAYTPVGQFVGNKLPELRKAELKKPSD
jgi:hypothetical protein